MDDMQAQTKPHTGPAPALTPGTPTANDVRRILDRRSYAVIATTSAAGWPHAAGVLFQLVGNDMWVNTLRSSRKARNVGAVPRVGISVPVRRIPIGPPSSVQFQAMATVIAIDDPAVGALVADGQLKSLTSHGELDLADGCFLRLQVPQRIFTHGLGMSLRKLASDPVGAGRTLTSGLR